MANQTITHIDVLIVGSGPAGSSVALHLLQRDPAWAKRLLIIDKATHPRDKLCGGGITFLGENILTDLGLQFEPNNFPVREVKLSYRDIAYSFFADPALRIVRRCEFDHWLVQKAVARGATLSEGEALERLEVKTTHVEVTTDQRTIHAQVVVAADGSRSAVRSRLKWPDVSRVARLLEVDTPTDPAADVGFREQVAVFDFSNMTDGVQGYYWDFPSYVAGEAIMNRGIFDSRSVTVRKKANLKSALRGQMARRQQDLDDFELKGAPIRWFEKNGCYAQPRVLLAGDAAGADPLFGEGISFALGYGPPVADAIEDAFGRIDFSFDSYTSTLMHYWLFRHLALRTRLAKIAYRSKNPAFVRFCWRLARHFVRLTPWRNRNYRPGKSGQQKS